MTPPLVHWPWPMPDVWRHVQPETSPTAAKPSGADLPTWQLSERSTSVAVAGHDEPPAEQEMSPDAQSAPTWQSPLSGWRSGQPRPPVATWPNVGETGVSWRRLSA